MFYDDSTQWCMIPQYTKLLVIAGIDRIEIEVEFSEFLTKGRNKDGFCRY